MKEMEDGRHKEITIDWAEKRKERVRQGQNERGRRRERETKIIRDGVGEREKDVIMMREGEKKER